MADEPNFRASYECSELIEEIKDDIAEFGSLTPAYGVWKEFDVKVPFADEWRKKNFCVNYLMGDEPPRSKEVLPGEVAIKSTLGKLLAIFEEQNRTL